MMWYMLLICDLELDVGYYEWQDRSQLPCMRNIPSLEAAVHRSEKTGTIPGRTLEMI